VLERLIRWSERWRPWHAALLSVLLCSPCIVAPLFTDDVLHRLVLEGLDFGLATRPHALYSFVPRDPAAVEELVRAGVLPWWTDPRLAITFFRPLTSATLALDHAVLPWSAELAHVQSLLWVAALIVAVGRLHRRLVPERAGLATMIYALATALAFCGGWISARHALVSATFAALAIERWLHTDTEGRRSARDELLGLGALALGLAAGESAASAPLFYAALTFARPTSAAHRARMLAAPIAAFVIYAVAYVATGHGARASGGYLDPVGAPLHTAGEVALRALAFVTDGYLGIPCDAAHGGLLLAYAAVGLSVLSALALVASRIDRDGRRELIALVVAGIVASAPGTLGFYGGRVLLLAIMASSAAAAWIVGRAASSGAPAAMRRLAWVLVAFLLVLAPAIRALASAGLVHMSFASRDAAMASRRACDDGELIVVVGASDPAVGVYTPLYWVADAVRRTEPPPSGRLRVITMAPVPLTLARTGERALRVTASRGALFASDWEHLHRRELPPVHEVPLGDTTLRWTAAEGAIDVSLTPEAWARSCWLRWDGASLVRMELPATGERVELPWIPGPMGL
jgi:hypothetical protein